MQKNKPKINCPTFQKQEPVIKNLKKKINLSRGILEKVKSAEELQKEVDVLLSCSDYDESSINCKNCRFIADLRKNTASLIINTKKLAK